MEFYFTEHTLKFFRKNKEQIEFQEKSKQKISEFIANGYFRIKPIKQIKDKSYNYYELKIHVGNKDYRVAFAQNQEKIVICYISKQLEKHKFDKEMQKWWSHSSNEIEIAKKI